ncbi:MAG: baseplate J/gp47 family protein [Synergistaceae bacterium]|nr:baseplate J/gp47 family protein [Synergistaceae bacterium]
MSKDHAAIVEDCVARVKERYGDKWNDYEEDSAGMMLIESFAYVTDLLLFYLDRQANETYLPTASERQNLINLCKLIGYNVAGAQAAQADILATLKEAHTSAALIPKGTRLETREGVVFETQSELIIPAGETLGIVSAIEGETFEETIGTSDGEANQEFYLPRSGVIELLELIVGAHQWDAADSVADHLSDDAVFMVDLDAWGRARITFGDGRNGRIPEKDSKIKARYRVGGGTAGNVAPNTITVMRDIATDTDGNRVGVEVTNPASASGGTEPESADRIKLWAPRYYETQNRCVTQTDYETIAMTFRHPDAGAIAKARAVVRERSGEANVIRYYVLAYAADPKKVALASQGLKNALLAYIDERKMLTDWIEIEDGTWREIGVEGTVRAASGIREDDAHAAILLALEKLFTLETREMGEPLRISDLYSAIDNVGGILHVELSAPQATVEAESNELLVLGEVDLTVEIEGMTSDGTNQ